MATRRPNEELNPDNAALVLTPTQRAAMAFATQQEESDIAEDYEDTPADRVARMLEDVGTDARAVVKLYKITGPNKFEWECDYTPQEFESGGLNMIREIWGPGEHQVRLYGEMPGTKRYVVRAKENIILAVNKSAPAVARQQDTELSQVLRMMAESQQQILQALTSKAPAVDPMAQFRQMLEMQVLMRQASGESNSSKNSLSDVMATIRELRAVSEEINPPQKSDADPDNPLTMLPQLLDIVKLGMQNNPAQQPMQFPPVAIQQQPLTPVQQPQTPQEDETVKLAMLAEMKEKLKNLIEKAKENSSHTEAAQYVYEEIPDEFIEVLFNDEWFDILRMVDPAVETHKEWLTKVRDQALSLFEQSETEAQSDELVNQPGG